MGQPTEIQLAKLHKVLSVRAYALGAVALGVVGFFAGPLLESMFRPVGNLSDLDFVLSFLGFGVGVAGVLVLAFIHLATECPFCKKSFFNPFWWGSIFGNSCFRCGKGLNLEKL